MCYARKKPLKPISSAEAARALFDASEGKSEISALKMQKLVYIAHENHIASTAKPLISDPVEAWSDGPVFPALHRLIGNSDKNLVTESCLPPNGDLGERTMRYIKKTWDLLAARTGPGLSEDTHAKGTPWHMAMNPDLSFVQKLFLWRPKHPVIDDHLIRRYCRDLGVWR